MAEPTREDIEFLFQEEVLSQHGEFVVDLLQDTLEKKKIIFEGDLHDILDYETFKRGIQRGLRISFFDYGRFIEIRKHKKKPSKMETNTNQLIWGIKENTMKKKPKDVSWYSKNVYGSLNRLIGILMYEFTDYELARLKKIITNKIETSL
ncbi:hypothetical protein [Proteiniphilum sp. X52]|uniref:hypothetical protein n=1 Tax=Proteiniphilum sp. X52 TaxID=2382159 RepID=UPI000F0A67D3|nr:hypothetical protein [Proteiniphilum sp. X52]RNC65693.1 hypothetical protein D7D25_05990 [Proteiniphilum sp. X52]